MDFLRKHVVPAMFFVSLMVNVYQYNAVKFYEDGVIEALSVMGGGHAKDVTPKEAMRTLLEHIYNDWLAD